MNILIVNGHPNPKSFCSFISQYFAQEAGTTHTVELLNLYDLDFDLNLRNGYKNNRLEPDLLRAQQLIRDSDHLVFVYPTWWWTMPALLKGFIDRTFIPGFAFRYTSGSQLQEKLLHGKRATLLVTMDSPEWYFRWFMKNVGHFAMKRGILQFCGIKTSQVITFDNMRYTTEAKRNQWLGKISALARSTRLRW